MATAGVEPYPGCRDTGSCGSSRARRSPCALSRQVSVEAVPSDQQRLPPESTSQCPNSAEDCRPWEAAGSRADPKSGRRNDRRCGREQAGQQASPGEELLDRDV